MFLGIENGIGSEVRISPRENTSESQRTDIRVVGEPKGKFDRTAFVIMPFVEKGDKPRPPGFFDEVLQSLITPAANDAGFAVETAKQHGSDVIQSTIINQLLTADLVIADLTDHNPNVLFELGIRLAKELPSCVDKSGGYWSRIRCGQHDASCSLQPTPLGDHSQSRCPQATRPHQSSMGQPNHR